MNEYTQRYKIWLLLEAETPLSIGSGREGLTTDRLIARNAAGLPYIPGTGLAGSLRAAMTEQLSSRGVEDLFGFAKGSDGQGSRVIINSAHLLAADGKSVLEGLPRIDNTAVYYSHLAALPVRDHVRISARGAAADTGKFDEQVCYKGVRFVGSLELIGTEKDAEDWQAICNQFASPFFRIGGGTRKGFGSIKVVRQYSQTYDLTDAAQRKDYLETENTLQVPLGKWQETALKVPETGRYQDYRISLKPRDFFFFGAGYGDDESDDVYKTESSIDWSSGSAQISKEQVLIPASSVKGALRHRVAFHYNKATGNFIDEAENPEADFLVEKLAQLERLAAVGEDIPSDSEMWDQAIQQLSECTFESRDKGQRSEGKMDVAAQNTAVKTLFGYAADQTGQDAEKGQRGSVLISDCFLQKSGEKVFDHVRIDRFTGGASDGALFQEKTVADAKEFNMNIWVAKSALADPQIKAAWHAALNDLLTGNLPLGGKTTKGHGFFTGTCNTDLTSETQS